MLETHLREILAASGGTLGGLLVLWGGYKWLTKPTSKKAQKYVKGIVKYLHTKFTLPDNSNFKNMTLEQIVNITNDDELKWSVKNNEK